MGKAESNLVSKNPRKKQSGKQNPARWYAKTIVLWGKQSGKQKL